MTPRFVGIGLLSSLLGLVTLGCGGPDVVDLEGNVTYDGQPIDAGSIALIAGEKGRSGGGSIIDGKIVMNPENRPPAGSYRVEIRWSKKTGKKFKTDAGELLDDRAEALPDKYHNKSTLTADLKPGKNKIDFDLKK